MDYLCNRITDIRDMKTTLLVCMLLAASSFAIAQETSYSQQKHGSGQPMGMPPTRSHFTVDSLNTYMDNHLNLTEKQEKKVKKLNSKYSEIIEGMQPGKGSKESQRPPQGAGPGGSANGRPSGPPPSGGMRGMQGSHGGMDGPGGQDIGSPPSGNSSSDPFKEMESKQDKYDKQLRKILNESQYSEYEKVKPKFASQRMYRDFLLRGNTPASNH